MNKKDRPRRKLSLRRESLRKLQHADLGRVQGGRPVESVEWCLTDDCTHQCSGRC